MALVKTKPFLRWDASAVRTFLATTLLKKVVSLVAVEGVLLAAMVVYVQTGDVTDPAAGSVRFFPYGVLAAGLLTSWRFRRSRLLYGLLVLAFADQALLHFVDAADRSSVVYHAVAFLLPVNLASLALLIERGMFTKVGMARMGVLLAQVPLVAVLPGWAAWLLRLPVLPSAWTAWTPLPAPALLAFGAGFGILGVRLALRSNATGRGFLWAMIASFLALHVDPGGPVGTFYNSTAGLILVVSVLAATYFMAYRDRVTGLPARRALNEAVLRLSGDYTVAMVDVDHFKKLNDEYGHEVGDQVLRMVAAELEGVGGGGQAYRYGGAAFALLFPGKVAPEALPYLEELRDAIERAEFSLRGPDRPPKKPENPRPSGSRRQVSVTVSIGASGRADRRSAPSEVFALADRALHQAKKAGRNRVSMGDDRQ